MYKLATIAGIPSAIKNDGTRFPFIEGHPEYARYKQFLASGGIPTPKDPPTPAEEAAAAKIAKNTSDISDARTYVKLSTLSGMTPTQVQSWMAANVQTPGQIQDVTTTLAIATSILWRDKE